MLNEGYDFAEGFNGINFQNLIKLNLSESYNHIIDTVNKDLLFYIC